MLYLTLGLVHYHQKKHHLYELDHTPVGKEGKQTQMTNLSYNRVQSPFLEVFKRPVDVAPGDMV